VIQRPKLIHSKAKRLGLWLLGLGLLSEATTVCWAQDSGGPTVLVVFPERQKERKANRWTLADWLATKKTIAAQNSWLAAHTNKVPGDLTVGMTARPGGYLGFEADAYLFAFGLRARYEQGFSFLSDLLPLRAGDIDPQSKNGALALQLRLFGGNIQNTNLIFRGSAEYSHVYGINGAAGPYWGYSIGPELQIYFANWLGVRGDYTYRFTQTNDFDSSLRLKGNSFEALAFLEVGSLRFEGGWWQREYLFQSSGSTVISSFTNSGILSRLRLFF
jgi:hypothetical protein